MITLLAGIVITITHALEAVTGFGCTVLSLPFVTALLGMNEGVVLLTVLGWLIALYFVVINWSKIDWRQYLIITVIAGLGLPLGRSLSHSLPIPTLKVILACFIIFAATLQFIRATRPAAEGGRKLPLPALASFLFLGGIVHGVFSSGGPLIVLYATRTLPDKGKFRATLCLLWTTLNPMIMLDFARQGRFDAVFATRLGLMLPFLVVGIILGDIIHNRVNPVLFRKTVFMALLAVGVVMLVMAIPRGRVAAPRVETPAASVNSAIVREVSAPEKPVVLHPGEARVETSGPQAPESPAPNNPKAPSN